MNQKVSNEDLEKIVDSFLQTFPESCSKALGVSLRFKPTSEMKQELIERSRKLLSFSKEIERIKALKISEKNKLIQISSIVDNLMRTFIPAIPKEQHALDWFIQFYQNTLRPPRDFVYLSQTKFDEYRVAFTNIIVKIYDIGNGEALRKFLNDISKSDDAHVVVQSFFTRLLKCYEYLQKPVMRVTKRKLEKYIYIYDELSGHFEKQTSILVGLLDILKGIEPNYQAIRKRQLGINLERLDKSLFKPLITSFRRIIRNAIAHKTYAFDPINKKIEFINRKGKLILNYDQFICETRELSSVVFVLWQLHSIRDLCELLIIKELMQEFRT